MHNEHYVITMIRAKKIFNFGFFFREKMTIFPVTLPRDFDKIENSIFHTIIFIFAHNVRNTYLMTILKEIFHFKFFFREKMTIFPVTLLRDFVKIKNSTFYSIIFIFAHNVRDTFLMITLKKNF